MNRLSVIFHWCLGKLVSMTSEDDQGQVVSSTRVLTVGLYVLIAAFTFATIAYVFVALHESKNPDAAVVGALVGGITAIGATAGYMQGKRS